MRLSGALTVAALLCGAPNAGAAPSRCVDCHLAITGPSEVAAHVAEWRGSAHATHGVTCDNCHGGQPAMSEARWAHQGVIHSSSPRSPVNRANLFRTCAPCHAAQALAFSHSLQRALLDAGDRRAPSCSSCHGGMTPAVPSAAALETRCAGCHPSGSPRAEYPGLARAGVEEIAAIRATLARLSPVIAAVDDRSSRLAMRAAWDQATRGTVDAVAAFHAFDLPRVAAALDAARRDTDAVRRELERDVTVFHR